MEKDKTMGVISLLCDKASDKGLVGMRSRKAKRKMTRIWMSKVMIPNVRFLARIESDE